MQNGAGGHSLLTCQAPLGSLHPCLCCAGDGEGRVSWAAPCGAGERVGELPEDVHLGMSLVVALPPTPTAVLVSLGLSL